MADQLKTSIVRIRAAHGAVAGAGCLVAERHVLTCSSVVARSLGLAGIPTEAPQSTISLDFPLLNPMLPLAARVVFWQPHASDGGDIAGLEIAGNPPAAARPTRLVVGASLWGHQVRVFGFPERKHDSSGYSFDAMRLGIQKLLDQLGGKHPRYRDALLYQSRLEEAIAEARYGDTDNLKAQRNRVIDQLNQLAIEALSLSFNELCGLAAPAIGDQGPGIELGGVWAAGVLRDGNAPGRVQIDGELATRPQPGFSGAPVWDEQLNGLVGILSTGGNVESRAPFVIPSASLEEAWPIEEILYLRRLIAELEQRKGILAYVELAAQSDTPEQAAAVELDPAHNLDIVRDWGLDSAYSLLEETTPSNMRSVAVGSHERKRRRLENILEAVREHPRFALIGEPGAGKTTTIRRLARDAARARLEDRSAPLPLLLELPRWTAEATPADFVRASWTLGGDPTARLPAGDIQLFLDGLNEMGKEGPHKAALLREWLRATDGPKHAIVTCRAADYAANLDLDLPTVLAEELDEPRIRRFAEGYLQTNAGAFPHGLRNELQLHR